MPAPCLSYLNLLWLYDFPNWLFCLVIVATFVTISLAGQWTVRPLLRRWFGEKEYNDIVGQYLAAFGVFYGITLGLLSVGTWENFSAIEGKVSEETAALAALYRTVEKYPEPAASALTGSLRQYTRNVIDVAWPQQRKGIIPESGNALMTQFHRELAAFEPATEGKKALHIEALSQLNKVTELRRTRLHSVNASLPPILWVVILTGSFLNMSLMWLYVVENKRLHDLLTAMLAALLGLLVFLLALMDYPFRGEYSVGPEGFELVYEQLMKK